MRGYFGVGIEGVKLECNIGTLFRTAHILGASFVFTVGRRYKMQSSDTTKAWRSIPLYHHPDFDSFFASIPKGCRLVGVELHERSKPIKNYIHPERAVYLLGAEDGGLSGKAIKRCHEMIQIPGKHCLNVSTAGSIVIYDRMHKQ